MAKVAVFHPGTQHSAQTALALQQLGRLQWYATSIFYQPGRWPYRLEKILPGSLGKKLGREFRRFSHPLLDPELVRTSGLTEWVERIASRGGYRNLARRLDRFGNERFVTGIARDLRSPEPFALWGYNGSSERSFALARKYGRTCILDRTNGDFRIYNAIMEEVADRYGEWFLPTERAEPESNIERDHREYRLADRILVGSPFAEKTIKDAMQDDGIANKIEVLNYCYDEALFGNMPDPQPVTADEPVRFLFLGLVIPRKGIHHVLEAISHIPRSAAELTIVGGMKLPPAAFAPYADRVTYIPTVPRAEVPRFMAEHHVFLLPSYFEGAGITLYEALAAGSALIQSDRCAPAVTPDTGILLDNVSTESVYTAMMTAIEDRDRLNGWRANAKARAADFTFAHYRENIADLLDRLHV